MERRLAAILAADVVGYWRRGFVAWMVGLALREKGLSGSVCGSDGLICSLPRHEVFQTLPNNV